MGKTVIPVTLASDIKQDMFSSWLVQLVHISIHLTPKHKILFLYIHSTNTQEGFQSQIVLGIVCRGKWLKLSRTPSHSSKKKTKFS